MHDRCANAPRHIFYQPGGSGHLASYYRYYVGIIDSAFKTILPHKAGIKIGDDSNSDLKVVSDNALLRKNTMPGKHLETVYFYFSFHSRSVFNTKLRVS